MPWAFYPEQFAEAGGDTKKEWWMLKRGGNGGENVRPAERLVEVAMTFQKNEHGMK